MIIFVFADQIKREINDDVADDDELDNTNVKIGMETLFRLHNNVK